MDWLPGMKNIRLKDLPSYCTSLDSYDHLMLTFSVNELKTSKSADAIIFNTFSELESETLNTLSSIFPPLYTIGPLPVLLNEIPQNHVLDSIGSNMWIEDTHCIPWLEKQKPKYVIYVNFRSITIMSTKFMFFFYLI